MAKKLINTGDKNTDEMLKEKTFQDFNNKEPDLKNPNETKPPVPAKRAAKKAAPLKRKKS